MDKVPLQSSITANTTVVTSEQGRLLINNGLAAFSLIPPMPVVSDTDLVRWLNANSWIEPSLYDHVIPATDILPLTICDNHLPWKTLTWCYDPYESSSHTLFSAPELINQWYRDKLTPYLVKTYSILTVELGWVCYNQWDNTLFVHHNQVKGSLRNRMTQNQLQWIHRYFLKQLITMIQPNVNVVIPDITTISAYVAQHPELLNQPITPNCRHVLEKSGFSRITGEELYAINPTMHGQLYFTRELSLEQQRYWIYQK